MEDENIRVEELIEPGGRRWELSQLQTVIIEEERVTIQSIYVSQTLTEDILVWLTAIDGVTRPKLVYHRIKECKEEGLARKGTRQ